MTSKSRWQGCRGVVDAVPIEPRSRSDHPRYWCGPQDIGRVGQKLRALLNLIDAPLRRLRDMFVELQVGVLQGLLLTLEQTIRQLRVPRSER